MNRLETDEDAGWAVIAVIAAVILGAVIAAHGFADGEKTLPLMLAAAEGGWAAALVLQVRRSRLGNGSRVPWKTLVAASGTAVLAHQAVLTALTNPARHWNAARLLYSPGLVQPIGVDGPFARPGLGDRFLWAVEQTVEAARESVSILGWSILVVLGAVAFGFLLLLACMAATDFWRSRKTRFSTEDWRRLTRIEALRAHMKGPDSNTGEWLRAAREGGAWAREFFFPSKAAEAAGSE